MSSLSSLPRYIQIVAALVCTSAMIGCGATGVFPDSTPLHSVTTQNAIGSISGNNYGGHAPLVGAHIYLVQPGTAGYGSVVTGLLSAGGTSTYPTTANGLWTNSGYASDQFVPTTDAAGNPFYGVTTNANGEFNITGDYTCTIGQPVFLIGYGGNPAYVGPGPNVFPVATEETYNDGSSGVYLTYTTSSPELFYVGESVTVSGSAGGANGFNQTGTVLGSGYHYDGSAAPLTTTSFTIFVTYNATLTSAAGNYAPAAYGGSNVIATGTPTFNPAAVNIAMLGICPSSGNFSTGSSAINYVYMNEVSTTAFAYAMNQYANWSANDQAGNDEFHIGSPNTTQALRGIANAALTAANLYDIQGSNVGTANDGDGHIARSLTASGAGIVPQAELDTVANILAACVDSNNTYRLGTGTQSPQCITLGQRAQDNGVYDTTATTHIAFNIVQAAMNIAHYPQGAGTGTTTGQNGSGYGGTQTVTPGTAATAGAFTSGLFNIPSGNVPFVPQLASAPNDFSAGINWQTSPYALSGANTGSTTNQTSVGEVAIDSLGNAWIVANGSSSSNTNFNGVFKLAPTGYYTAYPSIPFTAVGTTINAGIAIDTSNNLFLSSTAGVQVLKAANNYAAVGNGNPPSSNVIGYVDGNHYNLNVTANGGELAIDSAATPSIYVADLNQNNPPASNFGDTTSKLIKEPAVVGNTTATFTVTANGAAAAANTANACTTSMAFLTLDGSNNIWTSNSAYEYGGLGGSPDQICKFSNTGTLLYSYYAQSQNGRMIAVDASGNAFWPNYVANTLMEASSAASSASGVNGTATTYTYPSGILTGPWAIAVDGANTLWVASRYNSSSLVHISDSGVLMSPTFYQGSTGAGGFNSVTGGGTTPPAPSFAVIDQSGNIWTADAPHGEVIEWIGVAAPTIQPLVQQRASSKIGQMP